MICLPQSLLEKRLSPREDRLGSNLEFAIYRVYVDAENLSTLQTNCIFQVVLLFVNHSPKQVKNGIKMAIDSNAKH